jgi:FkbM family methyltransferase
MRNFIEILKAVKKKRFPSLKDKIEKKELLDKRTAFYRDLIAEGDICFDVGANVGNRIEPLLEAGGKVVAVEPQKSCYKYLKTKFGDAIELVPQGLGAEECEKTFYISSASTISSFSEEWIESVKDDRFKNLTWKKQETVQLTTLDALIKKFGIPAFIKIDVEGYELEVLSGLSYPVKTIAFEYTVPEQTQKAMECIKRIQEINGNTEFNYSIGESMEFALTQWLNFDDMCSHITTKAFAETSFGDIYTCKI